MEIKIIIVNIRKSMDDFLLTDGLHYSKKGKYYKKQ